MKDRTLLFFLIALSIICSAEAFVILTTIPPATADTQVYWLLFLCLFGAVAGILSLIWHPIKSAIHHSKSLSRMVSIRQTSFISLILVLLLFFKSIGILTIWDSLPLLISVVLVEFFFEADKTPLHDTK